MLERELRALLMLKKEARVFLKLALFMTFNARNNASEHANAKGESDSIIL